MESPINYHPAWLGDVGPFTRHHPVFELFKPFSGDVSLEFQVEMLGNVRRNIFTNEKPRSQEFVRTSYPVVSEAYFEWIDVLQSVVDAKDEYAIVELGAAYGYWSVIAACAARSRGIKSISLGCVEPEPKHVLWLKQNLSDNQIALSEAQIFEAAVSDQTGETLFYVEMPSDQNLNYWFGQAIVYPHERQKGETSSGLYYGHPVIDLESGYKAIKVEQVDLSSVLREFREIDLLDIDIQGQELAVLSAGADLVDEKVKRMHIGTHSPEIELGLRKLFHSRGWINLRDYEMGKTNETPFGEVVFGDGVQSWVNPRFEVSLA